MVECQLPKLDVAGSTPVARSTIALGGAPRFIQGSIGSKTTIVNGKANVFDGEQTCTRAGFVIRHGS